MSGDINVARLIDRIDTLSKANDTQAATIDRYRRRAAGLEREVALLRGIVAEAGAAATQGAKIEGQA